MVLGFLLLCVTQARGGEEPKAYRLRGVAGLSAATKLKLAESGEPVWYTPTRRGTTLEEAIEATCGVQGASVDNYLREKAKRLNYVDNLQGKLEPGLSVAIPFCLKVDKNVAVTVEVGDTLEGILRENYGVFGPTTIRKTIELNAQTQNGSVNLNKALEPGRTIIIPHSAEEQVFVERAADFASDESLVRSLEQIIAEMPAGVGKETFGRVAELNDTQQDPHNYEYVRFVSAGPSATIPNCTLEQGATAIPVVDRVLLEERLAAESRFLPPDQNGAAVGLVGVIDTGIRGFDNHWSEKYFGPNWQEKRPEAKPGADDDGNRYIDDIYGINFNINNGEVGFYPADPDHDHGTKIASLILGGRDYLEAAVQEALPLVRLKIVNFSSSEPGKSTVAPPFLPEAIDYLMKQRVRVINMSLQNGQGIAALPNAMRSAADVLFVVAAGNSQTGRGKDLAVITAFPARHGGRIGDFSRRVVTVGAHDLIGEWASFSHYSSEFVDLLAPGCAVMAEGVDGKFVPENGTSVATAIVSFAAALISSLHEDSPDKIKIRLLVGTDVDDGIRERAWTSGRLNIIKSISLSHDVVEMRKSGQPYVFTKISDRNELRKFCDDKDTRAVLSDLVKVRPNLGSAAKPEIEYWKLTDNVLAKIRCAQTLSNQPIGQLKAGDGEVQGPTLEEIKDIVLSSR